jgi:transitional endoplasmic reticulum ATPase
VDLAAGVLFGVIGGVGSFVVLTVLARRRGRPTILGFSGTPQSTTAPSSRAATPPATSVQFEPAGSRRLPTFAAVGGNDELKREMTDTIGLLIRHAAAAEDYRISWNGVLLHGPPGTGKSFFARAVAGEFELGYIHVETADLVSPVQGAAPERVEEIFSFAMKHLPCLVFFDEIDAVTANRGDPNASGASRELLAQLLTSLEQHHSEPRLIVMAATNDVSAIDPAITRPGRFDRMIRLDLPDAKARQAVFAAALKNRPCGKIDFADCARRTKGLTPAAIVRAVDAAALAALREKIGTGKPAPITINHLVHALTHTTGTDRPTVEDWSWDRLVLHPDTMDELKELQSLIEDPEIAAGMGVDAPTGVLLTGPPGTGKTTIAKVIAAEARCSFYPVSAADVTSKWVGDSERAIARLFQRARDNAPSIIFIDEIDAIAPRRGTSTLDTYNRQLDQLLTELDGVSGHRGVTVIGATNRPADLDPALLRGGRLSRTIQLPLPDEDQRLALLVLLTERMPLAKVDLERLALETEGYSGADLKALCQQAALEALVRSGKRAPATAPKPTVSQADFTAALHDVGPAAPPVARRAPRRAR